ncbi:helix-turn-helix domain-containing protein [Clostridium polynesiense]|uniref:helix-turn-helix domain-containing protein n=1 Tax=Clostridium polynesiense TaxID=1325933 RepID=UPI00058F8DDA|nr:helix-turn-helix transcriptional regulator [Clostridium polynesiense]
MEILSLGEKIKRKRKELNMTLKDLAGERITPGQISLVESGKSNPSMDLLEYLAEALKTTVEYLMESEESQAEKICTFYEQIAEGYINSGDLIAAEKKIETALYYAEKYDLEYRKARNLFLRAEIYMSKGDYALAQQFFLSANVIFIKNNKNEEIIETFLHLAKITYMLKAYHSSNSYLQQAEKVFIDNNIGNDFLLGKIYFYIANTFFKLDNLDKAINYSYLAKQKFMQIGNRKEYAKSLLLISEEISRKGELDLAIDYSTKALEVYKELEDMDKMSNIENSLGKLFYEFDNIEESFTHYEKAIELRKKNKDSKLIETLINICENYIKLKDIKNCNKILDEILENIEDNKVSDMIEYYMLKYRISLLKDDTSEAESILHIAFNYAKSMDYYKDAAEIAIMLGKFYMDRKNDTEAAKFLDEGVNLFKKTGILRK